MREHKRIFFYFSVGIDFGREGLKTDVPVLSSIPDGLSTGGTFEALIYARSMAVNSTKEKYPNAEIIYSVPNLKKTEERVYTEDCEFNGDFELVQKVEEYLNINRVEVGR